MRVTEAIDRYQCRPHARVRVGTTALWRAAEARWRAAWENCPLSRLDFQALDKYFRALLDRGWAQSTLRREVGYLRRFLVWCHARGWLAQDLSVGLPAFTARARRRRVALRPAEIHRLLEACRAPYRVPVRGHRGEHHGAWTQACTPPPWLWPLVLAAVRTLLRLGDLLDLRWREVDLTAGLIQRTQIKTGGEVSIPIRGDLLGWLASRAPQRATDRVFDAPDRTCVWRAFKAAVRRAGIQEATFHDLRSSGATWLLEEGVPLHLVQAMGGWSRPDVLIQIYAQVHRDHLDAVAQRLAGFGA